MVIPYHWRGGGAKPLFYLLYLPLRGMGFSPLFFFFADPMQSLEPSPGFPFGKPVGDELFRAWLQGPKVLQLNPWCLAAPGSFLKGAWCGQMLEARPVVLSVLVAACLAGAVVTAGEQANRGIPFPAFLMSFTFFFFSHRRRRSSGGG